MNTISKSEIHSIEELIEKIVEADKNYNTQKIRTAFEFADKAHGDQKRSSGEPYIDYFKSHFHPIPSTALSFAINITDKDSTLIIETDDNNLNCYYGTKSDVNATIKAPHTVIENIISGESTLQGAFMTGEISASGNFKILRTFDSLFQFRK